MGRPPLRKKGAMTAAERQRRHRRKLRKEQREAEVLATRVRHLQPQSDHDRGRHPVTSQGFRAFQTLRKRHTVFGCDG
jgi:hypothetical protein